jgi:hypothetical protein
VRQKLVLVLVVLVAALATTGSAWAAGSKTFTDPRDDASAAPDITQLVVSNDDNGQITFQFTFSNRPTILTGEDVVALGLDTDANGDTGDDAGYEYIMGFGFQGQQAEVGKWDGSRYDFNVAATTLRFADGGRTISINRSEVGGTGAFKFRVVTSSDSGQSTGDTAPEGGLAVIWDYTLALRPQIVAMRAGFVPGQPRAGRAFALASPTLRLSSGQMVAPASYSCRATLAGKVLRAAGKCRWTLPRNARNKRLVVTVTASYGGGSASFDPYVFRVR